MIEEVENGNIEDDDVNGPLPIYSISSYGADYVVTDLVNRIEKGDIYVPKFQRQFVWRKDNKDSRFIESLLIGLPVPGIFLSKESETKKLLVIDGQQRLRTLQYFYQGKYDDGTEFILKNVQKQFEGHTYTELSENDRRQLDDSILHVTIVRQDEPSQDDSSIYQIFERLNTGGNLLKPQEIRACIYHGELNDLLTELNLNEQWRLLYGKEKVEMNDRLKDQELILRFFALYFSERYSAPMKEFLNNYMGKNRHCQLVGQEQKDLTELFNKTLFTCVQLGQQVFKPKRVLNAGVFDAIMVGVAHRLEKGDIRDQVKFIEQYQMLLKDTRFIDATQKGGTASEDNVQTRINLAKQAFANVK